MLLHLKGGNALTCAICIDLVTDIDEFLTSDTTEDQIVQFVEQVFLQSHLLLLQTFAGFRNKTIFFYSLVVQGAWYYSSRLWGASNISSNFFLKLHGSIAAVCLQVHFLSVHIYWTVASYAHSSVATLYVSLSIWTTPSSILQCAKLSQTITKSWTRCKVIARFSN